MELVRLPAAARQLGVSYPTLKQWIYRRKIRSVKTPGGHHRIPGVEIDRLLFRQASRQAPGNRLSGRTPTGGVRHRRGGVSRGEPMTGLEHFISGRNQLVGRVTGVRTAGLLSKVSLDVGGQTVTAIITHDAVRDLNLRVGETAAALIKATEVMIIRPTTGAR